MSDTYSLLREFADSWALLALFLFFMGVILWAFRPGSRRLHDDAAASIFREARPASGPAPGPEPAPLIATGCGKSCATCSCEPSGEPR
ncbi:cbb3-type cytochrome c oxidase subunit 3 [Roseivivax sp. CAU 1761]